MSNWMDGNKVFASSVGSTHLHVNTLNTWTKEGIQFWLVELFLLHPNAKCLFVAPFLLKIGKLFCIENGNHSEIHVLAHLMNDIRQRIYSNYFGAKSIQSMYLNFWMFCEWKTNYCHLIFTERQERKGIWLVSAYGHSISQEIHQRIVNSCKFVVWNENENERYQCWLSISVIEE